MAADRRRLAAALCVAVALNAGCALLRTTVQDQPVNLSEACAAETSPRRDLPSPPLREPGEPPREPEPSGYSPQALRTAGILGLTPLLRRMAELEAAEPDSGNRALRLLAIRQRLLSRLFLITEEIIRVEAEVSCEQGRVQELTDQLQTLKSNRSTIQTLATIIVSGVASITGGAILLGGSTVSEDVIAIVAGSFAAALGTLTILQTGEQKLDHERNLLKEIREGRGAGRQLVPESVWRLLTTAPKDERSLRDQLLDHWSLTLRELGKGRPDEPEGLVYFGSGGTYALDQLRTRSALLRALTGTLRRAHVYVEFLSREVFDRDMAPARGE
ncbi:hypothetical protein [Nitrospira moscoviensis]|uniref:Uncharacterized protein n=1 Tax=Nitrospira moscoviensis TaxID=42253 RepID=A0A0K2GDQ3_NITMO|nr:hypothetical protein [Nitrospira moscoviensis]ALA59086.1 exported protein of unknown function [Nitrospira moscoviensis]